MKHLITLTLLVGCLTASAQTKPKEVMTRTQMPGVVEKILAQPQYKKEIGRAHV